MNQADLKLIQQCDLNLLLCLCVLIEEQSVSKSAHRLQMSQPAMSQNLKKLRHIFNDPLFTKQGQGLQATEKARNLLPALQQWLQLSKQLILHKSFDPTTAHGKIRFAGMADVTQKFVDQLLAKVLIDAPNIEIEFIHKTSNIFSMLESGELDIATGGADLPPSNIHGRQINAERYMVICHKEHPLTQIKQPNFSDFMMFDTARYTASDIVENWIDNLAQQQHLSRKTSFYSSSILVLCKAITAGKHIAFVPERVLSHPLWQDQLVSYQVAGLPIIESMLYWHARVHKDPLIQWFKGQCIELIEELKKDYIPQR